MLVVSLCWLGFMAQSLWVACVRSCVCRCRPDALNKDPLGSSVRSWVIRKGVLPEYAILLCSALLGHVASKDVMYRKCFLEDLLVVCSHLQTLVRPHDVVGDSTPAMLQFLVYRHPQEQQYKGIKKQRQHN